MLTYSYMIFSFVITIFILRTILVIQFEIRVEKPIFFQFLDHSSFSLFYAFDEATAHLSRIIGVISSYGW